jgi:hypothetical protein
MAYSLVMAIKYADLAPTTSPGEVCLPCREYKGMVDCPECGVTFCLFCTEWCPECGEEIVYT